FQLQAQNYCENSLLFPSFLYKPIIQLGFRSAIIIHYKNQYNLLDYETRFGVILKAVTVHSTYLIL
ncbi:hypothetical protein QCC67_12600, partial [Lactiplantibacillus plantarum]|uniref:hypothetical protein n=1 Tax=Lactiplantibacillus plantarum TaxID=1590 RepID=UPI00244D5CF2